MTYADYEAIAANVTADNSLDIVRQLLDRAKNDSVETEAKIAAVAADLDASIAKYKDLQVDYIRRFTAAPGGNAPEVTEEEQREAQHKATLEAIQAAMSGGKD